MPTPSPSRLANYGQCATDDVIAIGLLAVSLLFSVWGVSVGWHNTIFDAHPFRQSQTALTAYYLRAGGAFFKYETPVLGPPWSVPFELPIYQKMVAVVSRIFHEPLDQAGRLVSIFFFYATFLPLFMLLRQLGASRPTSLAVLALFAASPFYIFWSHTFMIESTALCFAVAYLECVVLGTKRDVALGRSDWGLVSLSAIAGTLAGLAKITTYTTFFLAAGLWILYQGWKNRRSGKTIVRAGVMLLFATAIPFIAVLCWTHYSDSVKEMSPMGHFLTSRSLRTWNFGTLHQRLDLHSYTHFAAMGMGSVVDNIVGSKYILLAAFLAALISGRRRLAGFLVCLALYAVAIEIFFNVHFVHTYYGYANGIFLVAAVGVGLGAFIDGAGWRRWLGWSFLVLALGVCINRYFSAYYPLQHTNAPGRPAAAAVLDRDTNPNAIVAIYGLDWSSQLPYQARRRALMAWKKPGEAIMDQSISKLGAENVSALLICGEEKSRSATLLGKWRALGFNPAHSVAADDCEIYEP